MSNQRSNQRSKVPMPPKQEFAKESRLEEYVNNLKSWAAYEAAHLAVHQQLLRQLSSLQPGTKEFSETLFAVKLSGIKSIFCEENITTLQNNIVQELPIEVDQNGQKTGIPDFNILTKFLGTKDESPHPVQ